MINAHLTTEFAFSKSLAEVKADFSNEKFIQELQQRARSIEKQIEKIQSKERDTSADVVKILYKEIEILTCRPDLKSTLGEPTIVYTRHFIDAKKHDHFAPVDKSKMKYENNIVAIHHQNQTNCGFFFEFKDGTKNVSEDFVKKHMKDRFAFPDNGETIRKIAFDYNDSALLLRLEFFDANDQVIFKTPYNYSSKTTRLVHELEDGDHIVGL